METKQQYIEYVQSQLETIDRNDAVSSYDTGYGLHVVNEYLGDSCHAMDVRAHSIIRIRTPKIEEFDAWEDAWKAGCAIVRQFCNRK